MAVSDVMFVVDGVEIPCPSEAQFSIQDVSAAVSGRTDDMVMHKNRIGQKDKWVLKWSIKNLEDTQTILNAFQPEYFDVTYYHPRLGTMVTKTMYAGDRTMPVQFWWVDQKRYESISIDLIER